MWWHPFCSAWLYYFCVFCIGLVFFNVSCVFIVKFVDVFLKWLALYLFIFFACVFCSCNALSSLSHCTEKDYKWRPHKITEAESSLLLLLPQTSFVRIQWSGLVSCVWQLMTMTLEPMQPSHTLCPVNSQSTSGSTPWQVGCMSTSPFLRYTHTVYKQIISNHFWGSLGCCVLI